MHFNSISSYRKALMMELVAQQIDFQFMQVCKLQLHSNVDNVGLFIWTETHCRHQVPICLRALKTLIGVRRIWIA